MSNRWQWIVLSGLAALGFAAAAASGGGIEVPMQDTRAAGQADAFTAQADDPAAIYYNPAGLTQLHGTQFSLGAVGLFPDWRFHGDDGSGESMTLPSLLPHLYAESDLGTERLRVGLGVVNEFGLNEDWGNTGPLNQLVDHAKLSVLNVSPTVAYKWDDHLSLGVALNIYYGELVLTRNLALGPPPTPVGNFRLRGHDWAVGVTPSLMWKIDEANTIGLIYRSPFTLNLEGSAQVKASGIPEIGPSRAVTPLNLPQMAGIGYAIRPIQKLKVEADILWTDWNTLSQVVVHSPDPRFNGQSVPANWDSGFTYRLGVEYALTRNWTVRGGYAYSQDAVPQSTFTPLVPDSNYHLFAIGASYNAPRWSLDAGYVYIFRENRHIENSAESPIVNGEWENSMNGVMLTFTLKI